MESITLTKSQTSPNGSTVKVETKYVFCESLDHGLKILKQYQSSDERIELLGCSSIPQVDQDVLEEIANLTSQVTFRATDTPVPRTPWLEILRECRAWIYFGAFVATVAYVGYSGRLEINAEAKSVDSIDFSLVTKSK